MRTLFYLVPVLCTSLALSACTTRFSADFEADTAGAAPDERPAGRPDDRITFLPLSGPPQISVTNTDPLAGAQSLALRGPVAAQAFLLSEPLQDVNEEVTATWVGRLDAGAAVRIFVTASRFSEIAVLDFAKGKVIVNDQEIGTYLPGGAHTVLISANPSTDTVSVSVLGRGSQDTRFSGPVNDPQGFPQQNIEISVLLQSGTATSGYTMDSIRISEDRP